VTISALLFAVGMVNSLKAFVTAMLPILLTNGSVNHSLPSGPRVML